ncbi:hypothetical protein D9M71_810570 [compost metagenome]
MRHRHEAVPDQHPPHQPFIWIRIDPYHQVIAFFHHVHGAVFGSDIEPHLWIALHEFGCDLAQRHLREQHRCAHAQPPTGRVAA